MITISLTIPSVSPELILALTFILAPVLLFAAFRLAASMGSAVRHLSQ